MGAFVIFSGNKATTETTQRDASEKILYKRVATYVEQLALECTV